jgi:hypothetical protein
MRESQIEAYLVKRVAELGGECRKVQWIGRNGAPDRVLLLPWTYAIWVEVKNPETILTFPADARERAQAREHERMRALGQRVEVIGTIEGVEELLK